MHTQFWFIYTLSNRSNTGLLLTQTLFDIIMKHMKETQLSYSDYLGISTYLMKHRAFNLYFGKSIASDARGPGSNPVIDNYLALTFEKSNISKKIFMWSMQKPVTEYRGQYHRKYHVLFGIFILSAFRPMISFIYE